MFVKYFYYCKFFLALEFSGFIIIAAKLGRFQPILVAMGNADFKASVPLITSQTFTLWLINCITLCCLWLIVFTVHYQGTVAQHY